MNTKFISLILGLILLPLSIFAQNDEAQSEELKLGFQKMYNLEFEDAHRIFQAWENSHPEDPLGPVSNAAAYLFSEFNRLNILQMELFADDDNFSSRARPVPDPEIKKVFEEELTKAEGLANKTLTVSKHNRNALFASVLANGLRGDYAAMIEKRNFAALKYIKSSRATAADLLKIYPDCYDAYLAEGVENYLLSLEPAPLRWILRMGGARTNRNEGLHELTLTAEKGYYLAPYARLLMAVAAVRDKNQARARELLAGLSNEFPGNELLKKELGRAVELQNR
jgi:hypothetical protein